MICGHKDYNLGDKHPKNMGQMMDELVRVATWRPADRFKRKREIRKATEARATKTAFVVPLYLYDHSGRVVSTVRNSCAWDSMWLGFMVCPHARARRAFPKLRAKTKLAELRAKVLAAFENELEVYNQYLAGDVHWFSISVLLPDGTWDREESCGGFYGVDPRENGMLDHIEDRFHPLVELWCRENSV